MIDPKSGDLSEKDNLQLDSNNGLASEAQNVPSNQDEESVSLVSKPFSHWDFLRVLELLRKMILKNEASSRPERLPQPSTVDPHSVIPDYSLGYSCNLLNNAYTFCKIARKAGINAYLFLDPKFADIYLTSLPQWEDVEFRSEEMPQDPDLLPEWEKPDHINVAQWNLANMTMVSQAFEYEKMQNFFKNAALDLKMHDELSYLMVYTVLPHKELLELYNIVDILHVSGTHIGLASFTNKPYVTFPYGTDLYHLPFEDMELGWMQSRGFKRATRHIASGDIMLEYMKSLGIPPQKIDRIPFMIDTDVYAPSNLNDLRQELKSKFPGKVIFLIGARQNWVWKGSDKLWKAIEKVKKKTEKAVFLTVWYGQDTLRSDALIEELNIGNIICKIGVLSKKLLQKYIDASDVCIDQFTHGGLGTFSLESMSCAKTLITYYTKVKHFDFEKEPPLLTAFSEDEIAEKILYCIEHQSDLPQLGSHHREWIKCYHGHEVLWPCYDEVYKKAIMEHKYKQ